MKKTTFKEWLARRDEGLLSATRPPLKGMSRTNVLPITNGQRKRLYAKQVKAPNPFRPTIRAVAEVVPQWMVGKLAAHSAGAIRGATT